MTTSSLKPGVDEMRFTLLLSVLFIAGGCARGADPVTSFVSRATSSPEAAARTITAAALLVSPDAKKEFDEEYGAGATETLVAGVQALDVDHHRVAINTLHEQGRITTDEHSRRIKIFQAARSDYLSGKKTLLELEGELKPLHDA